MFGQSQKRAEVKPFTSLAGPIQTFGSGTTKPPSAFSSLAPRATPQGEDDDKSKGNEKEAFPEGAADNLEPKKVHTGPGLFGILDRNTTSTSSLQSRLGGFALSDDKTSPMPPEEKRITSAFGQKVDPDANTSSLWANAAGGTGAASAFFNAKPGSNQPLFGSFRSQATGQSSSAFRSSGSAFVSYERKGDPEGGSDGEGVLSESEGGTKPSKVKKNKEGYLTPDEEDVEDEEDEEDEEDDEDDEEEGEEGEESELSDEEDEGLPVVEEEEEEEEEDDDDEDADAESGSVHEEDDTGEPVPSSTPKDGSKTPFQWKEGALDNAANAKPASSSSQTIPWHGFSANLTLSRPAKVSSSSPLVPQATMPKPSTPVITPVPKMATPLFGGSGAQSAENGSSKISARPKTPPGLFGVKPTTTPAVSQSDLQSKMVNITSIGSTSTPTPQPQALPPAPPRSKYQELQDQLNTMLANALGHNDEVSHIVPMVAVSHLAVVGKAFNDITKRHGEVQKPRHEAQNYSGRFEKYGLDIW